MTVLPVISREMRVAARHPFTFYLRVLGVLALLLVCLLFGLENGFSHNLGSRLFASLRFAFFGALWLLVPLLTADTISRERREGTLGLLFLTRLNATDVVTAKTVAQSLRAFTLWLAVVPVLTIPFLLGGVSGAEALFSVAINFSAICWALAAGLIASAWSKQWLRALVGSCVLSIFFALGFLFLIAATLTFGIGATGMRITQTNLDFVWLTIVAMIAGPGSYLRFTMPAFPSMIRGLVLLVLISLLALLLAIVLAGWRTRRVWHEQPASRLQVWWQRTFCTPMFWLSFFKRWMLRKLERNPIGWLEQRTWTGRLVTWSWFAVIISFYSAELEERSLFRHYGGIQRMLAWLLVGSLAMSAAGSFRRERESGVLELLLVSPLSEGDIISGRLRGLWSQFFPAFGILLGVWIYFIDLFHMDRDATAIVFHAMTFLALPVIGLYFSLRCRNFVSAYCLTLTFGLVIPILLWSVVLSVTDLYDAGMNSLFSGAGASGGAAMMELVIAGICAYELWVRLRTRSFPLVRN